MDSKETMDSKFTAAGLALFADWEVNPKKKKPITHIALGDLTDEQYENSKLYTGTESKLHNQKYFGSINRVWKETTIAKLEAIINPETRGWHMREVGLFVDLKNEENDKVKKSEDNLVLVWISKHPDTYVPENYQNMIINEIVTIPFQFANADMVEVFTTNAALARMDYVKKLKITCGHSYSSAKFLGTLKINKMSY